MSLRSALALAALLVAAGAATQSSAAQERLEESGELHRKLVELLIEKPDTSLTNAAEYANGLLPQYGLHYVLDAFSWLEAEAIKTDTTDPKASTDIPLKSNDRTLIGAVQGVEYEGACGERWLEIPAVNITATTFEIIHRGERIAVERPAKVWVERMKVLLPDQQSVLVEVFIPNQGGPAGVSADGKGVLLAYPLATGTRPWWDNVRQQHPNVVGQHPYLLLEVRTEGIRFVTEPQPYGVSDSEWITDFPAPPDNAFLRRWRFLKSGYVVEFTGPCT